MVEYSDPHDRKPTTAASGEPSRSVHHSSDGLDRALHVLYSVAIASLWWRTLILTIISGFLIWLSLWLPNQGPGAARWSGLMEEIGGGLFIAGLGAAIVQAFVMSTPRRLGKLTTARATEQRTAELRQLEQRLESLGATLGRQMEVLFERLGHLEKVERQLQSRVHRADALDSAGVVQLYARRSDAYVAMSRAVRDPTTTNVCILGVRLAHLVRSNIATSPWRSLESDLITRAASGVRLDVRVLLVDPNCAAARLLDGGGADEGRTGSLHLEVQLTIDHIRQLKRRLPPDGTVSLEVSLYRTAPQSFILLTDNEVYLQPYTYAPRRHETAGPARSSKSIALVMYENWSSVHAAAHEHFNLVWENSVPFEDIYERASIGVDRGVLDSGIVNVFTDPQTALKRIVCLIRSARRRVWIQGVSLNPMFARELDVAMNQLLRRHDVPDVRLMILDPTCEQARLKSFREHAARQALLGDPPNLDTYLREGTELHENSKIYNAITTNLRRLRELMRDSRAASGHSNVQVRCYTSAPVAYILIADDRALVEQYHYGKQEFSLWSAELQLTEEMALFEYHRLARQTPPHPFAIIEDHFEHVFNMVAQPIQP